MPRPAKQKAAEPTGGTGWARPAAGTVAGRRVGALTESS